jgi:hypothetical protein
MKKLIFFFLVLVFICATKNFMVTKPIPILEGTYQLTEPCPKNCYPNSKTYLRAKSYLPNRYFLSMDMFKAESLCASCCERNLGSTIYLVEQRGSQTVLLKQRNGLVEVESIKKLVMTMLRDSILEMVVTDSTDKDRLHLRFKYLGKDFKTLFDYTHYQSRWFEPQFDKTIPIPVYEYPDTLCPVIMQPFSVENVILATWVNDADEFFYLVHSGLKNPKDPNECGDYRHYKYHFWIRERDFWQRFKLITIED